MPEAPYRRVHVIINPASGGDEPILNVLNDVFRRYDVDWDVSVTHRYGDAAAQARRAVEDGVDLVAGYGGDGTQHEIANALVEAAVANGAPDADGHPARGDGQRLRSRDGRARAASARRSRSCAPATRPGPSMSAGSVTSGRPSPPTGTSSSGLYVGVEPEEQTSRELKDRYGVFAYLVNADAACWRGDGQRPLPTSTWTASPSSSMPRGSTSSTPG